MEEDEEQRQRGDDRGCVGERDHHAIHHTPTTERTPGALACGSLHAAGRARRRRRGGEARRSHIRASRETRHTSQRASAFTISVTAKSTAPTAMSVDWCSAFVASFISLAITDAIVYAGAKSDAEISARFPITMVTAIVSPSA